MATDQQFTVEQLPYPAPSKSNHASLSNVDASVTCTNFSDKILLTITFSNGKLAHWVHVPLATSLGDPSMLAPSTSGDLLPRTDLTATTVLGGTKREDEAVGQTLATMLASQILVKRPSEERMLVLGMGPVGRELLSGGGFEGLVGLCLSVL